MDNAKRDSEISRLREVNEMIQAVAYCRYNGHYFPLPTATRSRMFRRLRRLQPTIKAFGINRLLDVRLPDVRTDDDVFPVAAVAVRSAPLQQPTSKRGLCG
jgi:hypothetical protein